MVSPEKILDLLRLFSSENNLSFRGELTHFTIGNKNYEIQIKYWNNCFFLTSKIKTGIIYRLRKNIDSENKILFDGISNVIESHGYSVHILALRNHDFLLNPFMSKNTILNWIAKILFVCLLGWWFYEKTIAGNTFSSNQHVFFLVSICLLTLYLVLAKNEKDI